MYIRAAMMIHTSSILLGDLPCGALHLCTMCISHTLPHTQSLATSLAESATVVPISPLLYTRALLFPFDYCRVYLDTCICTPISHADAPPLSERPNVPALCRRARAHTRLAHAAGQWRGGCGERQGTERGAVLARRAGVAIHMI